MSRVHPSRRKIASALTIALTPWVEIVAPTGRREHQLAAAPSARTARRTPAVRAARRLDPNTVNRAELRR